MSDDIAPISVRLACSTRVHAWLRRLPTIPTTWRNSADWAGVWLLRFGNWKLRQSGRSIRSGWTPC